MGGSSATPLGEQSELALEVNAYLSSKRKRLTPASERGYRSTLDLFHSRLVKDSSGCWLWQGTIDRFGYPRSASGQRIEPLAHRLSYALYKGPIPEGLTIDHLCRVRHCVNPEHLEAVTLRENIMRGDTIAARNAAKTHCKRGHEFTPENTYTTAKGNRGCKACRRTRQAVYDRRKRAEAKA